MPRHPNLLRFAVFGAATALVVATAGCSASDDGKTTITYLVQSDATSKDNARALADAFSEEHPSINVTVAERPSGGDGDNYIKTQLSTGSMADVFAYQSGSPLQALRPDSTLVDLSGEKWVSSLDDQFRSVVSTDKGLYGAPLGTIYAGGVMYNKSVYAKLHLEVPTTWDQFIANSETIKSAGITPIIQTYGDTWTSQLFVLGDFGNVSAQDPDWADEYTKNKAKYADAPASAGFEHLQEVHDKNLVNEDYASATNAAGMKMLASGEGAQYPITSNVISQVQQDAPEKVSDMGVFALPADDAADTTLTVWQPGGLYIPKSTTGAKLRAAKQFLAFMSTPAGCTAQLEGAEPAGPFPTTACSLPDDVPHIIADETAYIDADRSAPALEFLSPVKGPSLEKICVQVGSGISSAKQGAVLYDQDVEAQAQQLGLAGW